MNSFFMPIRIDWETEPQSDIPGERAGIHGDGLQPMLPLPPGLRLRLRLPGGYRRAPGPRAGSEKLTEAVQVGCPTCPVGPQQPGHQPSRGSVAALHFPLQLTTSLETEPNSFVLGMCFRSAELPSQTQHCAVLRNYPQSPNVLPSQVTREVGMKSMEPRGLGGRPRRDLTLAPLLLLPSGVTELLCPLEPGGKRGLAAGWPWERGGHGV